MLYEMLEGTSPIRRETAVATIAAIALDPVPTPHRAGRLTPLVTALMAKDVSIFAVDEKGRLMGTRLKDGKGPWTTESLSRKGGAQGGRNLPAAVYDPKAEATRVYTVDTDGGVREWSTGPTDHTWSNHPLPEALHVPATGTAPTAVVYHGSPSCSPSARRTTTRGSRA